MPPRVIQLYARFPLPPTDLNIGFSPEVMEDISVFPSFDISMNFSRKFCLSSWVCDSFALFGGIRFGKHKVAPQVSPHKTWEGCVCGAASSLAVGLALWLLPVFPEVGLVTALATCFIASSLGQIGDLAESLLKRMIGVKDFSNLIPGHGGMFDRADSLLFSIPAAYICLHIAGLGM